MTSAEHPWEKIYKKDGRIFPEPFPRFHEVVDLFVEHACSDILDLGCGSGRHTVHLALVNFKTFGLDFYKCFVGSIFWIFSFFGILQKVLLLKSSSRHLSEGGLR